MKLVQFSMYYVKLQLTVLLGLSQTLLPMDINWRWRFWRQRYHATHRMH